MSSLSMESSVITMLLCTGCYYCLRECESQSPTPKSINLKPPRRTLSSAPSPGVEASIDEPTKAPNQVSLLPRSIQSSRLLLYSPLCVRSLDRPRAAPAHSRLERFRAKILPGHCVHPEFPLPDVGYRFFVLIIARKEEGRKIERVEVVGRADLSFVSSRASDRYCIGILVGSADSSVRRATGSYCWKWIKKLRRAS